MAYALTTIRLGAEVDTPPAAPGVVGTITKHKEVKFGEPITQAKAKVDDETWEMWHTEGIVSDTKPPKDYDANTETFVQYRTRKLLAMLDDVGNPDALADQANALNQPETERGAAMPDGGARDKDK